MSLLLDAFGWLGCCGTRILWRQSFIAMTGYVPFAVFARNMKRSCRLGSAMNVFFISLFFSEFGRADKDALFSSVSVAAYSPRYWVDHLLPIE